MARIKLRRDTEANWIAANPVLDLGEPGYVTDTEQLKIGDGVQDWNNLPYFFGGFDGGTITNALNITANGTNSSGALILSGIPYPGEAATGLLQVGEALNFVDDNLLGTFVANIDSYAQVIVSNKSNGTQSSADFVINNDTPLGETIYGDFGINGTNFVGTGGPFDQPNGTYLFAAGGELAIGTKDSHNICFATNDTVRLEISNVGEAEFQPSSRVHILNTTDSTAHDTGALVIEGGLGVGKTIVADDNLYLGAGAVSLPLTNPVLAVLQPGADFIQAALTNSLGTGSADWIAYGSDSTEVEGWASFGFTGPSFADPAYTITENGEGYIFVQGKSTSHGSLVLCTGDVGTDKDIVFGTGGFLAANERIRLHNTAQQFHIMMTTVSTNTDSGALRVDGGVGIDGALNVGGAINKVLITPPASNATLTLGTGITLSHPLSLTFPSSTGSSGGVLTTNGSGTLSWTAQASLAITQLPYYRVYNTNYNVALTDNVIIVDNNGSPTTVTLPQAAPLGKVYTIKKTTAASTVTINTDNVFCLIDGSATYTLNNLDSISVVMGSDGANNTYYITGKST